MILHAIAVGCERAATSGEGWKRQEEALVAVQVQPNRANLRSTPDRESDNVASQILIVLAITTNQQFK